MTVELKLTLDRAELAKFRRLLVAGRTEAAKALTFTAQKAQTAWRLENHRDFHMRNSWIDRGVRIQAATGSRLEATVGTIDKFMSRHVIGADAEQKRGAGGGRLFVPIYDDIANVAPHQVIRRQLKRMASTSREPFIIKGRDGESLLARRIGKGRGPLTILGALRQKVHIKPRMDVLGVVDRAVRANFGPVYERLLLSWAERG